MEVWEQGSEMRGARQAAGIDGARVFESYGIGDGMHRRRPERPDCPHYMVGYRTGRDLAREGAQRRRRP